MNTIRRLTLIASLSTCLGGLVPGPAAFAQGYPSKPIRIVVPYSAGGLPDTVARIVANRLLQDIGQAVYVENKPGGQGAVAVAAVLQGGADGYTFMLTDGPTLWTAPLMNRKVAYAVDRDLVAVSVVGKAPLYLAVGAGLNVSTLDQFIALAKSRTRTMNYGSSGIGSIHHLTAEAMNAALGVQMTHIPYRGSANSVPALVGGEVDLVFASPPSISGFVKTGQVRLIAINASRRARQTPDVPALAEKIPGFDFAFNVLLLAPRGTPPEAVQKISAAVAKIVHRPDVIEQMEVAGVDVVGDTPAQADAAMHAEGDRIVKAARTADLKAE